jgi:hypothetical protein
MGVMRVILPRALAALVYIDLQVIVSQTARG